MKKAEVAGHLLSVMSIEEFEQNRDLYNPRTVAIETAGHILPIRNSAETEPGLYYRQGMVSNIIKPSPEQESEYSAEKVIDLSHPSDIGEIMAKSQLLRNIQNDLMVSGSNNILRLNITQEDTPEMRAIKSAINSKQIDKKDYEERFSQFQNDMRILRGHSITLGKLITICNGFDISCELTLRNRDDMVANPMVDEITIDLTEGRPVK